MARGIAAVTIGQSPRADLLEPLLARLPADVEVIQVGALDALTADTLPRRDAGHASPGSYPLTTRLRDGSPVTLDEADLAPLVQGAIDRAELAGAEVTLLLCAGGFLDATARGLLVRPFDAAAARLRAMGARRIAVMVPFEAQAAPAARKWADAGFDALPIAGDPRTLSGEDIDVAVDAIVLDYVGHPSAVVVALRSRTRRPVLDLGECGADAAARLFDRDAVTAGLGAT